MKEHDLTRRALYFDFYGSLLTDKQREIYDLYYQQDLSFGEISKIRSVSREAVYDLLKRTEEALKFYESKLGLVKKYQLSREISKEIAQKIENIRKRVENDRKDRQLQEELAQLAELLQNLDVSW